MKNRVIVESSSGMKIPIHFRFIKPVSIKITSHSYKKFIKARIWTGGWAGWDEFRNSPLFASSATFRPRNFAILIGVFFVSPIAVNFTKTKSKIRSALVAYEACDTLAYCDNFAVISGTFRGDVLFKVVNYLVLRKRTACKNRLEWKPSVLVELRSIWSHWDDWGRDRLPSWTSFSLWKNY